MKKEYCQLERYNYIGNFVGDDAYNYDSGCYKPVEYITNIEVWRVLLGSKETPYEIINDIKKHCETEQISFSVFLRDVGPIGNYKFERSSRNDYSRFIKYYTIIPTEQQDRYMKNENDEDLVFLTKLDAINYLSKNGGWYLDHIVPIRFDGEYGGPISSTYIMARDVDK